MRRLSKYAPAPAPAAPNAPPPTAPRTDDSIRRLNSVLPQTSGFSWTNFSAVMLIASCPASVTPSVAAPVTVAPTTFLANGDGIPDFSSNFSTTPALTLGPICLKMAAGKIESSAAETDPANAAAAGSICPPVSSYIF